MRAQCNIDDTDGGTRARLGSRKPWHRPYESNDINYGIIRFFVFFLNTYPQFEVVVLAKAVAASLLLLVTRSHKEIFCLLKRGKMLIKNSCW